ncbi:endonuclease/exonuclease/phosphatase family protein [Xylanimonas ulmi]|uniref:Endonuclease/exonuclease/phosphatase family protein n=1 Tax=Xylanimonas ulmi TaxID=228973 RepID=A0A4Q7M932_9MICO|nr:endonuclease/exonuclease/phosphatase family protein [Xylanibacterium ulmi]RZS62699.1 endonuclease/exonuclease/phosphatase family protein [Xylanibacterium ulmi]
MSVRLATFNVRHARLPDETSDALALGRAVAGLDADVVALQEVDRHQVRSGGADLARVAAEAMGALDYRFAATIAGRVEPPRPGRGAPPEAPDPAEALAPLATARGRALPGAAAQVLRSPAGRAAARAYLSTWVSRHRARGDEPDAAPAYGVALLSRVPVREWRRVRLPLGALWPFGRLQLGHDEPRVALAAVVETPDGPLTVVTTHLSTGTTWNRRQLRWLVRRLRGAPRPLVLLGDLNIRDDEPAAITGWRELVDAPTYPRQRPRLRIDHVLVDDGVAPGSAPRPAVRSLGPARTLDLGISDHRAVVVDLARAAGAARAAM